MTQDRDLRDYLQDILDALEKIERFTSGMSLKEFSGDDKTAFAVIRALEVIGEAAKKAPEPVRQRYPLIPWREMAATRDKLIHGYFGVDLEVVWKTIQQDLAPLKAGVTRILNEIPQEGPRREKTD